ncbi:MAG TPA: hypothetical protein VMW24_13440 [Sedimentisphaerales bacterium]|nr:hypothetical protein [Sedimentisphaerales bacterium]
MNHEKPVILWLADQPGWAYAAIIGAVAERLPQYDHVPFYACMVADPEHRLLNHAASVADVVVSMFLRYQEWLGPDIKHKAVTMVTGFRPFEEVICE